MRYTQEYRVYSWDQDYDTVVAAADNELAALGFVRSKEKSKTRGYTFASWSRPDGAGVYMDPGLSRTRKEAFDGKGRADGVTVMIGNTIPDDWMAHVRLVLEPSDF